MTPATKQNIAWLGALVGALVAVAQGFDALHCAGRPEALAAVVGSFGGGIALGVLVRGRHTR